MTKKNKDSQGEIIDEVRAARAEVLKDFKEDPKHFEEKAKKAAKKLKLKYGTPKHKKLEDDAA